MTGSVGFSYRWVALQLYMKGHKVNENSIKTLLAFTEITKPCSELNISFSFFFKHTVPRIWDSRKSPTVEPIFQMRVLIHKEMKALILKGIIWVWRLLVCWFGGFFFFFFFWKKSPSLEFMFLSVCLHLNSWRNESRRKKVLETSHYTLLLAEC